MYTPGVINNIKVLLDKKIYAAMDVHNLIIFEYVSYNFVCTHTMVNVNLFLMHLQKPRNEPL